MRFGAMVFGLAVVAAPVAAQGPLTADQQGYIAYDQCMMHAAIAASRTAAQDGAIFALAKADCAATRARVIVGQEGNRAFLAALDAADADKAANFPAWIKGVGERRRAFDAGAATPNR